MGAYASNESRPARGRGVLFAVAGALLLLQLVLGGHLSVMGAVPDFLLVLTACVAFFNGSKAGCVAGFICGLLVDLLGSGPVGVSSLLGCAAGYVLGSSDRAALSQGWHAPWGAFAVAALLYNLFKLVLLMLVGSGELLGVAALGRVVVSTLLDALVAAGALAALAHAVAPRTSSSGGLRL